MLVVQDNMSKSASNTVLNMNMVVVENNVFSTAEILKCVIIIEDD